MRLSWLGLGLGLALAAGPAAAEGLRDDAGVRTRIMWRPADLIWTGALPAVACGPRLIEPNGERALATRIRRATYERRGELIAELRAPLQLTRAVVDDARVCAAQAAEITTTPAMLTAAPAPFERFHTAFAACLGQSGAAKDVGSLTLWIDTSCNW